MEQDSLHPAPRLKQAVNDMQSPSPPATNTAGQPAGRPARIAGGLMLITAAATAVMVFTRVSADADQETLLASLRAVEDNRAMYGISGIARFLSGSGFFAAAWFLLRTWIIRDRWATPLVPYLFSLSGICTVLSGACAVLIALYPAPDISYVNGVATGQAVELVEVVSGLRWITGKIGFAAAGLALIVAARYQWQVGGTLRRLAPLSVLIGVAMQFIWVDAATVTHPIVGTAFFLWLLAVGTMLATGRVERHFVERYGLGCT